MANNETVETRLFRGMKSMMPATAWEEALITGNGTMGALVFGQPLQETVIFNHERLYEPLQDEIVQNNNLAQSLPDVRTLMKNGRFQDAARLFSQRSGHPLLFTDAYHPAYALKLDIEEDGPINNYERSVHYETGEVKVQWEDNRGKVEKNHFVSRDDNVIVIQIKADQPFDGVLFIDPLVREESVDGYEVVVEGKTMSFICNYKKIKKGYVGSSVVDVKDGGKVISGGNQILFLDTKEVMIVTRIIPVQQMANEALTSLEKMKKEIVCYDQPYDTLLHAHEKIHGEWFRRVSLSLCDPKQLDVPTEQLLSGGQESFLPLLQLMFDMGRYLFISSSGQFPPNLVGIWTGEWRPAWSGDFTTDANINLAVSAGGIGHMPEALEGYFHLIEKIAPDWKVNAKTLYGCRGFLAGSRTDGNHNIHTHFNEEWPLGFWTAGAHWLILPFFEWYQISGDEQFFLTRTLPLLKEVALFYEDFLTEYDENGKYMFVPSYSPENTPMLHEDKKAEGWQASQASINATMDIAVAKELFTILIETCEQLQIEQEHIEKWKEMRSQLPDYAINEEGALKEWAHPHLHDNYDHRHISHLYPVWPGHEITPETNSNLFHAAEIALQKRKRGNYSAHGVMHCGIVAARQKNANLVYENLQFLLQEGDYIHSSLVTSHNPGKQIYNVDANCSLPTLVMEMLLYTRPGWIELLPALPEMIAKGSIKGILGRGQIMIDCLQWDLEKKEIDLSLRSRKTQDVVIMVRRGIETVKVEQQQPFDRIKNDRLSISLLENEVVNLKIKIK
ncbi:glycosyl hydrolase family 95 catalytic domain-containing protein [Alkalihalobacterium bogoriense]|uniref:glycosyl hydrolase family 95 catalytic domain-containing protein n=1 Tax=Alkalihalobacterium bogoriense TaxID=246272 RepID=UPI0006866665|nr:glycoside hydrolase N-terminal domain-containing protein [Alkalihalobacterium bogoriense]